MPGFWKRPVTRMYSYNLDLGEHYYYPISHYLEAERGTRGETPGALTFNERLARKWLYGRRYGATDLSDRYSRARSVTPVRAANWSYLAGEMDSRAARARSEIRTSSSGFDATNVSAFANYKNALLDTSRELRQEAASNLAARQQSRSNSLANLRAEGASRRSAYHQMRASTPLTATANSQSTARSSSYIRESRSRIDDDICKKVADVHMMPWSVGHELDEAQSASARARSRISELERELEEITKRAMMTSTHARRTAAQLAKEASLEDEQAMSSSYKKSRKVMIQTGQRVGR